jgi:hypothetical protein
MHRPNTLLSLPDLSAAGVKLRPYEAVTIVRELILQVARGEVAGVPSAHVIRLAPSGAVSIEGPVAAGGRPVMRAAQLLDSLLPAADQGNQFRVPGGLKLVLARALGVLDLPPFGSLEAFAEALARFAATDPAAAVTSLVVTWSELLEARAQAAPADDEPAPSPIPAHVEQFVASRPLDMRGPAASSSALTVSDIRRARRATGIPLAQVSDRSRIPVGLLRQLEWGYLANWPSGPYGRTQLVRYARATGLDEQLVVSTISPLIEEADVRRQSPASAPQVPAAVSSTAAPTSPLAWDEKAIGQAETTALAVAPGRNLPLPWPETFQLPEQPMRARTKVLAALAIPALLAVGLAPAWWGHSTRQAPDATVAVARSSSPTGRAGSPDAIAGPEARRDSPAETPATTGERVEGGRAAVGSSRGEAAAPYAPGASAGTPVRTQDEHVAAPRSQDVSAQPRATYRLASDGVSYSPAFASVGTAMFYHADGADATALVRADTDSRGSVLRITRIVDDEARNYHVRPSPDGSRIAFDSDRDGIRGVYVADSNGRNVHRVSPEGFAAVPSWSPGGSMLAFVRAEADRPQVWNLWTLDLESGNLEQITRHRVGQPWGGSWFPDGRHLAYSHETRLVIHDLATGAERVFNTPRKGRLLRTPAVSPDGRRVMFQVHRDGGWLLELADGSMRKVLDDPTAEEFTWSPDGRRLAYHSHRSGAWSVWVMAPR